MGGRRAERASVCAAGGGASRLVRWALGRTARQFPGADRVPDNETVGGQHAATPALSDRRR